MLLEEIYIIAFTVLTAVAVDVVAICVHLHSKRRP